MKIEHKFNDGGRVEAGHKGKAGDCVTRAIAIATGQPYQAVYDEMHRRTLLYGANRRDKVAKIISRSASQKNDPKNGVFKEVYHAYLLELGWAWKATMEIGGGCKVHLRPEELPAGVIIARVSRHVCAVIDGVLNDTWDCSRRGTRCVYGYYFKPLKTISHDNK